MNTTTALWFLITPPALVLLAVVAAAAEPIKLNELSAAKLETLQAKAALIQQETKHQLEALQTQANAVIAEAFKTQHLDPAKYDLTSDGEFVLKTATTTTSTTTTTVR